MHGNGEQTVCLGFAQVDMDRQRRCGFPEVVYAEGKTSEAIVAIFEKQRERGMVPLATRVKPEQMDVLVERFPQGIANRVAKTFRFSAPAPQHNGKIAIITAGTSDLPVSEEAKETALWMGVEVSEIQDVGVAGPHRLVENLSRLEGCSAAVVIAGMEGALPSVVGGYVDFPVVAVPTSVGYGANFGGISALLGMLNSCASNVTVVNIDAGFKGGYVAGLIATNRTRNAAS